MNNTGWFDVCRKGLRKLLSSRGLEFVIYELFQNAWDEESKNVHGTLEWIGRGRVRVTVSDDNPEGFKNLSHAFTLFAESDKKTDPTKRGRYNLGEKLVLAICEQAAIETTKGTVRFGKDGSRTVTRMKRHHGSVVTGVISDRDLDFKITAEDVDEACRRVNALIPPAGIETYFNGEKLGHRNPLTVFSDVLPTEVAKDDGILRRTNRKTVLAIHKPRDGEKAMIYEMGIPVVETGDKWHVDIGQKVLLNMDRDNVTPAYLKQVRVLVLNRMHGDLDEVEANSVWVQQATADERCSDAAIGSFMDKRFGEDRVSFDPSDHEANMKAASYGHAVVHGRNLSADQWGNIRRAGAIEAAGQAFPTKPKKLGEWPSVPDLDWTPAMYKMASYAKGLASRLMGNRLQVDIVKADNNVLACYGMNLLTFNIKTLGKRFFEEPSQLKTDELLIHEFGHHYSGNHLSSDYHDALCQLGAKMTRLALDDRAFFENESPWAVAAGVPQ